MIDLPRVDLRRERDKEGAGFEADGRGRWLLTLLPSTLLDVLRLR